MRYPVHCFLGQPIADQGSRQQRQGYQGFGAAKPIYRGEHQKRHDAAHNEERGKIGPDKVVALMLHN